MTAAAKGEVVVAVVVTHNRKELLKNCLDALLGQTYPVAQILVIDNASTDGTGELFHSGEYAHESRIRHVPMPENGGGAGGFHEGFKRALAETADWIWAMDDDGLPHRGCLERLLAAPVTAGQFRAPVVLAREGINDPGNERLAFPGAVEGAGKPVPLQTRSDLHAQADDGVVVGYACVFNGVLVHRAAAERIGLPRKEFFIWGDEWDYIFRTRRHAIGMSTVTDALYWHPVDRTLRTTLRVGPLQWQVPVASDRQRNYLLIRNYAYLAYRHRGVIPWVRHTTKYLLYHRTAGGCFSPWQVLRYSIEGLIGRFDGRGNVG